MNMINIDISQAKALEVVHRLRIVRDDSAENPREWCDHAATMYCEHRRYTLGDKKADDIRIEDDETGELSYPENYLVLPLYLYDHGGLTISTGRFSCPWDSGQVGYIYISHEKAIAEFGKGEAVITEETKERAYACMRAEVEEYDNFLTGNIYGFQYEQVAIADDGEEQTLTEDSCYGFNGYDPAKNGIADYLPVPLSECEIIREFCENHIIKLQKLHTKGTRILQRKTDGKLQLQYAHLYNGEYLFLTPNDHWEVLA